MMIGESAAPDEMIDDHSPADMLFVLTSNYNSILYRYTIENGFVVQSQGNISDVNGAKREAPYSCFVGANGKNIVMMLYDNIIKVIPLAGKDQDTVHLQNSFNIKIRHPESHMVMPLYFELHPSDGALAIFYQQ